MSHGFSPFPYPDLVLGLDVQQVALHRSLTSLLRAAETRPVNWRRYCASPRLPRLDDGVSSPPPSSTTAGVRPDEARSGSGSAAAAAKRAADRSVFAEFGSHPPVCVLFALCESNVRSSRARGTAVRGGSGELQPLLWQLLEITLRPEDPAAPSSGKAVSKSGKKNDGLQTSTEGSRLVPPGGVGGPRGASGSGGSGSDFAGLVVSNASEVAGFGGQSEAYLGGVAVVSSPARLLIAKGLVEPSTLVMMAQDLLAPGGAAEARKRSARVLQHLWAASPSHAHPEVRKYSCRARLVSWASLELYPVICSRLGGDAPESGVVRSSTSHVA